MAHTTVTPDGSQCWVDGVDSVTVPTIASAKNPTGLKRTQLAWLNNGTVRDGGISPRAGYQYLVQIANFSHLFQGGFMYEPFNGDPYWVVAISGHILKVTCSAPFTVTDLSVQFGLTMPATQPYFFFVQAEEFLVIQAGDLVTLPLFWSEGNGAPALLRRSKGITNTAVAPGQPGVNEIPAAGPMDYYQNRLWYAQGRQFSAGDIVGGPSGTAALSFRDAILNVTENPLVLGGDGFTVPTQAGNIRALTHNANINATLGQGQLIIGTRKAIYALIVPVTRADWIAASSNNQPEQLVIQLVNGPVNDRSVTKINGDLYYVSLEPDIRSVFASVRNWTQPGNISISKQEQRLLQFNDRSVLRFASGVAWDNRILMGQLPKQLPQGVVMPALAPLDFLPISTLGGTLQPVWEGVREGLQALQFGSADFGGLERTFAIAVSSLDGAIELWELTKNGRFDINRSGESRITWVAEFPAFTWQDEDELKKLVAGELGVDRVFGEVIFKVEYRQDQQTCWLPWMEWKICSARNTPETFSTPSVAEPSIYPLPQFGDCYRSSMVLPVPPVQCSPCGNKLPSNIGYQFQTRITVKGACRIRRWVLWAEPVEDSLYKNLVCAENLCVPVAAPIAPPVIPTVTPVPPKPPSPPASSGWKIQNLASVQSALVQQGPVPPFTACGASTFPAWNGIFNIKVTGFTGIIYWYFINQSINALEVAGNKATNYPTGNWMDTDAFAQLYFQGGVWHLWLVCTVNNELWFGTGTSADPTNPAGTYTALDSPFPPTITIAKA